MRCSLLLGMLVIGCDVEEPENVRGTGVGEPSEPDPLDDTSSNTYSCADGPAFPDFWAGAIDPGLVTDQPYDFDAGVGEARSVAAGTDFSETVNIDIQDAVVANFTTSNGDVDTLWIADTAGGMTSFGVRWGLSADVLSPGDTISFTITEVSNYFDTLQITAIDDTPTITGRVDSMFVVDGNAGPVSTGTHLSENVSAHGELVNDEGSCGGSFRCFTFSYGENAHTLRLNEDLGFKVGDCVQIVMPLGMYFDEEQYSVDNNNWVSSF
jgi:hypothetical protein